MAKTREIEQQALDRIAGRTPRPASAAAARRLGAMEAIGLALWSLVALGSLGFLAIYLLD